MTASSWSHGQMVALAVLPKISSSFSFAGSMWIFIEVITYQTKRSHPYHRMLCAMSIYDILESVWNFLSTWPIPPEEGETNQVWRAGTQGTCSAQGFFLTLSVAVPMYNSFLAIYYLLVIQFNFSDRVLRTRVEPAMHCVAFLWAFGTASTSVGLDLVNNANLWCWIAPYPSDCLDSWRYGDEGNCIRGDNAWIYRWSFYFAPLWFNILLATVCTYLVYRHVAKIDKKSIQYRNPQRMFGEGCSNHNMRPRSSENVVESEIDVDSNTVSRRPRRSWQEEEALNDAFLSGQMRLPPKNQVARTTSDRTFSSSSLVESWRKQRQMYQENYSRSLQVVHQATWYLGGFYITHVWSTTNRIVQQLNRGRTLYWLILGHSWFDPFQGFLIFLVYQRPRYLFNRRMFPEDSRLMSLWKLLRFSYLPELDDDQ